MVPAGHAVVGSDCDQAAVSQVLAVLFELRGGAAGPAAAKEEHDRRALVGRLVPGGLIDPQIELDVADGFVGFDFGAGQLRRVRAAYFRFDFCVLSKAWRNETHAESDGQNGAWHGELLK